MDFAPHKAGIASRATGLVLERRRLVKFILINAAIVAALAYLFVSYESTPGGSRGVVSDVVLKATELADRAVERVTGPAAKPAMPAKAAPTPESLPAPPPTPAATTKPEASKVETAKAETPKAEAPPPSTPLPASPPAVDVAPRPTHAVPDEAGAVARLGPEVEKRRSEVLDETRPKRNGRTAPKTRFAVKEGGTLMTPKERRRELDALIENMELVYLRHHGE